MATGKQSLPIVLVNTCLDDIYQDSNITYMYVRDFTRDGIHLTKYGTSSLPHNIRGAVEK